MSQVFVLDANKQALNPIHPGRARLLLKQGKAAVYRRYPFTIILASAVEQPPLHPLRIKVDPGSQTTGIALVNDLTGEVVWAAELAHRGEQIKRGLDKRRAIRRSRRQRKTRYRKPRFANRGKRTGTLPPSLESRVCNVLTWVRRLMRLCPVTAISQELVRFDTQALEHPDIEGVEYQQGQLSGYEVREYALLKWNHQCAYCDARGVPLELDHVQPRSKHGSNRVSNLTLACLSCNQRKGNRDVREFLHDDPARLVRMLAHMKAPLRDAAAVNATRWALYERLKILDLPVEGGSGGETAYNRVMRGLDKSHWLDAANVGRSTPASLIIKDIVPLHITATGHGSRQMCRMDKYGFPRSGPKQHKRVQGFQTGDLVRAVVTSGTKQGTYVGKVAVRTRGSFNITTAQGVVTDIHHRFCVLIARSDGYSYQQRKEAALPPTA
ncbi:MAG: HNH endonuclease [Chloroflexi bacterium]|nr:MAG: HNH endonuclease [Chloroflexota bacterium]